MKVDIRMTGIIHPTIYLYIYTHIYIYLVILFVKNGYGQVRYGWLKAKKVTLSALKGFAKFGWQTQKFSHKRNEKSGCQTQVRKRDFREI